MDANARKSETEFVSFLLSLRNMKLHYTWVICLWIVAVDSSCSCHCGLCTYSWPLGNNYSMVFRCQSVLWIHGVCM